MRWLSTTARPGRPILPPRELPIFTELPLAFSLWVFVLSPPRRGRRPPTADLGAATLQNRSDGRQEDKRVEGKGTGRRRGNSLASTRAAGHRPESEPRFPLGILPPTSPPLSCLAVRPAEWGPCFIPFLFGQSSVGLALPICSPQLVV